MIIIGLNDYHGDASACLLKDGVFLAAAEEERFPWVKHRPSMSQMMARSLASRFRYPIAWRTVSVDHFSRKAEVLAD